MSKRKKPAMTDDEVYRLDEAARRKGRFEELMDTPARHLTVNDIHYLLTKLRSELDEYDDNLMEEISRKSREREYDS